MMIVRIILSLIAGCMIGFGAMLLLGSTSELIAVCLAALLVAGIVGVVTSGLKGLNWLLAIIFGVATFFLYAALMGYIDEHGTMTGYCIAAFAPYAVAVFFYSLAKADEK